MNPPSRSVGIRDQAHEGQVDEVDHHQPRVDRAQHREVPVVADPEAADDREAEEVGEELRPLLADELAEVLVVEAAGDVDAQARAA